MTPATVDTLVDQARALDRHIAVLQAEQAALWGAIRKLGGRQEATGQGMVSAILDACAAEFGVTRREIVSDRRRAAHVTARHAACWLARHMTTLSYPAIARQLRRDHTTIMHSVHAAELRIGRDGTFAQQIATLQAELAAQLPHPPGAAGHPEPRRAA